MNQDFDREPADENLYHQTDDHLGQHSSHDDEPEGRNDYSNIHTNVEHVPEEPWKDTIVKIYFSAVLTAPQYTKYATKLLYDIPPIMTTVRDTEWMSQVYALVQVSPNQLNRLARFYHKNFPEHLTNIVYTEPSDISSFKDLPFYCRVPDWEQEGDVHVWKEEDFPMRSDANFPPFLEIELVVTTHDQPLWLFGLPE